MKTMRMCEKSKSGMGLQLNWAATMGIGRRDEVVEVGGS